MTRIDNDSLAIHRTKIYLDLLQSLALEFPSLQNASMDMALGYLISDLANNAETSTLLSADDFDCNETVAPSTSDVLTKDEMLRYGTPARHLLNQSTQKRVLIILQTTLKAITEFFHTDIGETTSGDNSMKDRSQMLPEAIELQKNEIYFLQEEFKILSYHLIELMTEAAKVKNKELDNDLIRATTSVFPAYDDARTASIDLLAAAIEASLIKISFTKARSERSLYNYQPVDKRDKEGSNVAQAIATALRLLKQDHKDMEMEIDSLDRQLEEYETLLNLVDGVDGGYQQVINDWTKVKQETDECLKDLRRLGWTGN